MSTVKTSRISTKGQVVIPADLRNELNLEPSDELVMARKGDKLIMRKLHLGDILEDAQEAFEEDETVSHEEMKENYGL